MSSSILHIATLLLLLRRRVLVSPVFVLTVQSGFAIVALSRARCTGLTIDPIDRSARSSFFETIESRLSILVVSSSVTALASG